MRCNPWRWLWGLIPVAMLSWITYHWERTGIEADLGQHARLALSKQGQDWAEVEFTGRDAVLRGRASEEAEPKRATETVRGVWGVRVVDQRTDLMPKPDVFSWLASLGKGKVTLSGHVPSEAARKSLLSVAKANFPKLEIEDAMQLARGAPPVATWSEGTSFALRQLAQLKRGTADMAGTTLTLAGEASDAASYKSVRTALGKLPSGIKLGGQNITPAIASPFVWSAKRAESKLVLSGHVPSDKDREDIFGLAKSRFPKLTVVDRMEIAGGEPDGWGKAVVLALEQMGALDDGTIDAKAAQLTISGVAADEATAAAIRKALRGLPGTFKLTDAITIRGPDPAELEAQRLAEEKRLAEEEAARREAEEAKRIAALNEDARRKAEEDARLRAEEEARQKASEEDARRKAEQEARMRAEEEARRMAEEDARRKAEEEARMRAEEEARRKADAEARNRAFVELEFGWASKNAEYERRRAEEEARRQAEIAAQEVRIAEANKCQAAMREAARNGRILFRTDSAELDTKSAPTLLELARIARACPSARVEISGHTDSDGDGAYNKSLSERRAQAIVAFLTKEGLAADRLKAIGYGEDRPVAPNDTAANKSKNRRIEFSVIH